MSGAKQGQELGLVSATGRVMSDLDRKFPGFGHDIHGVELRADGTYQVMCLTSDD